MMEKQVSIALIDDHQLFLDGLLAVIDSIDPAYQCVAYSSPRAALNAIEDGQGYDLIISDFVMEEMNGIAFLVALKARHNRAPVMILSGIDTLPPVEKVLQNGASGFVPKSASKELLASAIATVLQGEVFLPAELWSVVEASQSSPHVSPAQGGSSDAVSLGARQMEVLRLIADGYSNKRISDVLAISENTVKTHIKQIFKVLNVTRRTACVSKAQALGLLDPLS